MKERFGWHNFRGGEVAQGEVSTIIFGMLESSGFRKYSTLLVIELFSGVFVFVNVNLIHFWKAIIIGFQKVYGFGGLGQVGVGEMSP